MRPHFSDVHWWMIISFVILVNGKDNCAQAEPLFLSSISDEHIEHVIGHYTGESFDVNENIWHDLSGQGNDIHSETIKNIFVNKVNGLNSHPFIFGNSTSKIVFPVSFASNEYSIFYVARYFGRDTRNAIFQNENDKNWYSGFYGDKSGVSIRNQEFISCNHYQYRDSWIIVHDEYDKFSVNKRDRTLFNVSHIVNNHTVFDIQLSIHGSGFAVSEIIIFNKKLVDDVSKEIQHFLSVKYNIFEVFWVDQRKSRREAYRNNRTKFKTFLHVEYRAEYVEIEFDVFLGEKQKLNTFSLGEFEHLPNFWLRREFINNSLEHRVETYVTSTNFSGFLSGYHNKLLTKENKLGLNETHHVYINMNPFFYHTEIDGKVFCSQQMKQNASVYYINTQHPIITFWSWYNFSFRTQETFPYRPVKCDFVIQGIQQNDIDTNEECSLNKYKHINVYCGEIDETVFQKCHIKTAESSEVTCHDRYYIKYCNGKISWKQTCVVKNDVAKAVCCKTRTDI
eukprot:250047_1